MSEQKAKLLQEIVERVSKVIDFNSIQTYPRADHPESDKRGTSFQVLIQIIISQRCTLENEMLAANRLFAEYKTPQEIIEAPPDKIAELIWPAGMYKIKTDRILRLSHEILSRYHGNLDQLRKLAPDGIRRELLSLPGVGPKTADCMLELGFGIPYLPVDVNVDRVSRRLGLVPVEATKEEVRESLEAILPKDIKVYREVHTFLLALGKYYCKSRPTCFQCPVLDLCPYTEKRLHENRNKHRAI